MATSLINLALLYWDQREYEKAQPFFERALAIWERVLGPKHRDMAAYLENYAVLLRNLNSVR